MHCASQAPIPVCSYICTILQFLVYVYPPMQVYSPYALCSYTLLQMQVYPPASTPAYILTPTNFFLLFASYVATPLLRVSHCESL